MGDDQLGLGIRVPGGRKPRPQASRRKPGSRYAMGARKERDACEWLRRHSWTPTRSAGSRGPADIVAVDHRGSVMALQVKSGVNPPGPTEQGRILDRLRQAYPCPSVRVALWYWDTDEKRWLRFEETKT